MQSIPVTNSLFAITTSKKSNKDKYSLDENYTLKIKNVIYKKNLIYKCLDLILNISYTI